MLFNSYKFLIFFPIVVGIYFILPKKFKQFFLLISSYFFYMCWNVKYSLLMFITTFVTYISGLLISKENNKNIDKNKKIKNKKLIVLICCLINFGILFYFKYFNFGIDIVNRVLEYLNLSFRASSFDILLPVGISFYTFQSISYIIDVYRNDIEPEKNFIIYALFVSFFPQLVAGPIERSKNLLIQLKTPKKFDYDNFKDGFLLMLWGFFMKIVIADRAAIFVNTVYSNYQTYPGFYLIIATMFFAIQIYCDFFGYSTIATGAAKIFGIDLMDNFNSPYFSKSIREFWRRWHISLSTWFKDYLYFPLGGSRKGKLRKCINLMIVFVVSGIWHGANYTYIVWGFVNGLYQVFGELLQPVNDFVVSKLKINRELIGYKIVAILRTYILIFITNIIFRASNILNAVNIMKSIKNNFNPWILFDGSIYNCGLDSKNFMLLLFCILILFFADFCKLKGIKIREVILKQDYWFKCIFIILVICFILVFGIWGPMYNEANFVYFQF